MPGVGPRTAEAVAASLDDPARCARGIPVGGDFGRGQGGDPNRRKIARIATAHCRVRVMHAMLRTGETCRWAVAVAETRRRNGGRERTAVREERDSRSDPAESPWGEAQDPVGMNGADPNFVAWRVEIR